jgi:TraM recognition site of TraD and TraG
LPFLPLSPDDSLRVEEATVAILGRIGSGKSTSSYAALALAHLAAGHGGIALVATPEEAARWESYLRKTRRGEVIRLSQHRFNPLNWAHRAGAPSETIATLLMQGFEVAGRLDGRGEAGLGIGSGDFFRAAMESLVRAAIELLRLARPSLSLYDIHRVITDPDAFRAGLLETARRRVGRLPARHPHRHTLAMVGDFFERYWTGLNTRTRTSIEAVFHALATPLLYGELYARTGTDTTFDLTATHRGAVLLLDIASESSEAFQIAQVLIKAAFQLSVRRREVGRASRPVFCMADEAAQILSSSDIPFLALSRNKRAVTTYVFHSLAEVIHKVGEAAALDLLAHFRTHIFHNLGSDAKTMRYAAELIGETWQARQRSRSQAWNEQYNGVYGWLAWCCPGSVRWLGSGVSVNTTGSASATLTRTFQVDPVEFATLRTGGPGHGYRVDAIVTAGRAFADGRNYRQVTFRQVLG